MISGQTLATSPQTQAAWLTVPGSPLPTPPDRLTAKPTQMPDSAERVGIGGGDVVRLQGGSDRLLDRVVELERPGIAGHVFGGLTRSEDVSCV